MEERGSAYGEEFTYHEGSYFKSFFKAFTAAAFTGLVVLIISSSLRRVVRRFLPKPGEGPSETTMINGHFKCLVVAEAEDGEKRTFSMFANGDPGYRLTTRFICESAMLLAGDVGSLTGGKSYGGVLTPATALGRPMIELLLKRDVHFE
jgi:short subunit dehydrogenase-like uncharacterized protein